MKPSIWFVSLLAALVFFPRTTCSQVQTGRPTFGSFAGGPEAINLGNLNAHYAFPIVHKAGRGTPFDYSVSFDSSVYSPVSANGATSWQPVANWGWRAITEAATGYISRQRATVRCQVPDSFPPRYFNTSVFFNYQYHDTFGVIHAGFTNILGGCPGDIDPTDTVSTDSSGLTLHTSGAARITTANGATFIPPVDAGNGSATITDRNGNQITTTTGNTFTDTLGTTVLSVSGGAPSPLVFTYTDSSGNAQTVTMNYSTYTVQTNFGCPGISEYGPAAGVSLVSSISYPDGSSYFFTYEPTPGAPGNVTGRIQSITLRSSGTITYTYSGGNNGIICADGSTAGYHE